jgi:adenylate cyclase
VIENGGEVLKFIGDAVLAIFPIADRNNPHPQACVNALSAVQDTRNAIEDLNRERSALSEPPLRYGTALHRGDITYGNVGTMKRLDFTVIGTAVNQVSRIESLCKELGVPVLMSSAFAKSVSSGLVNMGTHSLRGIRGEQEIFTLQDLLGISRVDAARFRS